MSKSLLLHMSFPVKQAWQSVHFQPANHRLQVLTLRRSHERLKRDQRPRHFITFSADQSKLGSKKILETYKTLPEILFHSSAKTPESWRQGTYWGLSEKASQL